jgi:hypothetical protein
MNSYQMVLHRPVETARDYGRFALKLAYRDSSVHKREKVHIDLVFNLARQ